MNFVVVVVAVAVEDYESVALLFRPAVFLSFSSSSFCI